MAFPLSFFCWSVVSTSSPRSGGCSFDVIDLGSKIAVRLSNHVEERGRVPSLAEAARRERLAKRYVARMTRLAFVAPAIVDAVAKGRAGRSRPHSGRGGSLRDLLDRRGALGLLLSSSSRIFASLSAGVSKPSVNQP
jgi:hypothetical protein